MKLNDFTLKVMQKKQFWRPKLFTHFISEDISFKLIIKASLTGEVVFSSPRIRDSNYCIPMRERYILTSLFNIISALSALCLDQFIFTVM